MPTRHVNGEGHAGGEASTHAPVRSTGVVGTARSEGNPGNGGDPSRRGWRLERQRHRWRLRRESDRDVVPLKPGNSGGGKVPDFAMISGFERFRAGQFGIRHYCTIGLNPKEANNEALAEAVLEVLPRFLTEEGVVAMGELGYDEQTPLEDKALRAQIELARSSNCRSSSSPVVPPTTCGSSEPALPGGAFGMSTIAAQMPKPQTLLRLGRVSNLPTVWTDVVAGAAIASAAAPVGEVVAVGLHVRQHVLVVQYGFEPRHRRDAAADLQGRRPEAPGLLYGARLTARPADRTPGTFSAVSVLGPGDVDHLHPLDCRSGQAGNGRE
jgi:hypothetical protein